MRVTDDNNFCFILQEAADMILTEDDFSTILSAIEEGKCICDDDKCNVDDDDVLDQMYMVTQWNQTNWNNSNWKLMMCIGEMSKSLEVWSIYLMQMCFYKTTQMYSYSTALMFIYDTAGM